jgi:hypothetical protein
MAPTDDFSAAGPAAGDEAPPSPARPAASTAPSASSASAAPPMGPESAASDGPVPGGPDAPAAEVTAPPPKPESLIDALADLMQMAVKYMRQETAGVMRDKVVLPGQQLGMLVAFALAAAALLFLGIAFIAVAVLLVLAHYLGWPGALTLVGVVLLIGAGVFTYLKVRSIQS